MDDPFSTALGGVAAAFPSGSTVLMPVTLIELKLLQRRLRKSSAPRSWISITSIDMLSGSLPQARREKLSSSSSKKEITTSYLVVESSKTRITASQGKEKQKRKRDAKLIWTETASRSRRNGGTTCIRSRTATPLTLSKTRGP